jgi:hypothetical protein
VEKKTGTEEIRSVLDTILRITPREAPVARPSRTGPRRERGVLAEMNELRAARGEPPYDPSNPS